MNESHPTTCPSTISVATDLVVGETATTQVAGELRYDACDPYAVTLRVLAPAGRIDWMFARDLLSRGVYGPAGSGDVQVWPCLDRNAHAVVVVELRTPTKNALVQLPSRTVSAFLAATHRLVPPGSEGRHIDVDALLEGLRGRPTD